MANASAHKNIEGWGKQPYTFIGEYDFANDTGAQATYSLGTFTHKTLILKGIVFVETQATSEGSAVVTVGASTADADGFMDATSGAVANLADDFTVEETTASGLVVAAAETLDAVIATADLTAGKIKVILQCINVD